MSNTLLKEIGKMVPLIWGPNELSTQRTSRYVRGRELSTHLTRAPVLTIFIIMQGNYFLLLTGVKLC